MKKTVFVILNIVVLLLLSAGSVYLILHFYDTSSFFRSLFDGASKASAIGPGGSGGGNGFALQAEMAGKVSLYIFTAIIVVQFVVFFLAVSVMRCIHKSKELVETRMHKLDNADIFLDLPLYVGLFGTVASFIVMTFNPQTSRLIAYSSTLIGIIFSVFLRTVILFPVKQRLLGLKAQERCED
jgi:magnesium-transporting ATPase (P-type)